MIKAPSKRKNPENQFGIFGRSSRNRTYTIGVRGLCAATTPYSIVVSYYITLFGRLQMLFGKTLIFCEREEKIKRILIDNNSK